MKRVQQTVAPLLVNGAPKPVILPDLREVDFGDWTGLAWDEVQAKFGVSPFVWLEQLECDGIANAECAETLLERVEPCLRRILADHCGQSIETLTKDTVPVDVDAVLFWMVWDAQKAALEVEDYRAAITWAAQTALREVIGQMTLADILIGRAKMDAELQKIIDERTTPWGVTVQSVEIRDVIIPQDLEAAMSRQAQAERERQARVILGESELQIAHSFAEASEAYINNPTALHLRAMNMLFEGLKDRGALVIVPSSAVDTMNLGGLGGMVALAQVTQKPKE